MRAHHSIQSRQFSHTRCRCSLSRPILLLCAVIKLAFIRLQVQFGAVICLLGLNYLSTKSLQMLWAYVLLTLVSLPMDIVRLRCACFEIPPWLPCLSVSSSLLSAQDPALSPRQASLMMRRATAFVSAFLLSFEHSLACVLFSCLRFRSICAPSRGVR